MPVASETPRNWAMSASTPPVRALVMSPRPRHGLQRRQGRQSSLGTIAFHRGGGHHARGEVFAGRLPRRSAHAAVGPACWNDRRVVGLRGVNDLHQEPPATVLANVDPQSVAHAHPSNHPLRPVPEALSDVVTRWTAGGLSGAGTDRMVEGDLGALVARASRVPPDAPGDDDSCRGCIGWTR